MVAYGKAMRPSLVDVMAETNALASEMDKKIVLIVNYHDSVWPATATLEHTDGTTVTYDELASIANTVVIAFDTYLGAAALADIQKQIDDSIQITYQDSRYDDTTQAIIYDKVTVYVESGETPTVNIETDTFSGGGGSYTLPTASATTLGGVKVGSGLAIDADGVLSASGGSGLPYVEVTPTSSTMTFNELKAIAQSNNPNIYVKIIGETDGTPPVLGFVTYQFVPEEDDNEIITITTYAFPYTAYDDVIYGYEAINETASPDTWTLYKLRYDAQRTDIGRVN